MKPSSCSLILLPVLSLSFFTLQVDCKCQARINDEQRLWKEGMIEDADNPIPYLKDPKYGPEYYFYWDRFNHISGLRSFFREHPHLKGQWKNYDRHYGWREELTEKLETEPEKYNKQVKHENLKAYQALRDKLREESYAFRGKSGAKSPAKNSQGGRSSGQNAASRDSTRNNERTQGNNTRNDQRPQENTARNDQSSRRDNSSSQQRSQNSQRDNASSQRDSSQQVNNSDNQKSQNASYEEQVAQRDQEYKESLKRYYKEAHEYYRKHNTPESVIKEYLKEHYVPPAGA